MSNPKINRCVCFNRSFIELKSMYGHCLNTEELKSKANCCNRCRLCTPYIELMLKTGKTEFEVNEHRKST
jgi:hypothetical protein